jgi:flavin reductase (DIM6/NTAB) family NADH-FMN oxidoreductase RutF
MNSRTFLPFDWRRLGDNSFSLVANEWMLITAGPREDCNMMTASWGGFGHLWNRDVAFVFVRPTRHTFGYMEKNALFSLSFFGEDGRRALQVCGSSSGRDGDKTKAAGITSLTLEKGGEGWTAYEEARLVLACRKVHAQDLDPKGFIDPGIAQNYPDHDWHRLYVGAIEAAWIKG